MNWELIQIAQCKDLSITVFCTLRYIKHSVPLTACFSLRCQWCDSLRVLCYNDTRAHKLLSNCCCLLSYLLFFFFSENMHRLNKIYKQADCITNFPIFLYYNGEETTIFLQRGKKKIQNKFIQAQVNCPQAWHTESWVMAKYVSEIHTILYWYHHYVLLYPKWIKQNQI